MAIPSRTDSDPAMISTHSLFISFRCRIAERTSATPVMVTHAASIVSATKEELNVASSGIARKAAPNTIPMIPLKIGRPARPRPRQTALIPARTENRPSTKAKVAKTNVKATSALNGNRSAARPSEIVRPARSKQVIQEGPHVELLAPGLVSHSPLEKGVILAILSSHERRRCRRRHLSNSDVNGGWDCQFPALTWVKSSGWWLRRA